jgi:hypothetical protein
LGQAANRRTGGGRFGAKCRGCTEIALPSKSAVRLRCIKLHVLSDNFLRLIVFKVKVPFYLSDRCT